MSGSSTKDRPILSVKICPRDRDLRRLYEALGRVIERYPNISLALDSESQQITILGNDVKQLEEIAVKIRRKLWISLEIGESEVIYLETIRKTAESESKFIRQIGGSGNYAHLKLRLEVVAPDRGVEFIRTAKTIPDEYIPAVEQGVREAAMRGSNGNHEIVGIRVILYDGSYHEADSNEMAFRIAATTAFSEAVAKAGRVLLEPIMALEIAIPEEYAKIVKRDLANRRARLTGLEHRENSVVIYAIVPLAEMLEYYKGSHSQLSMHFLRYAEVHSPEEFGDGDDGIPAIRPFGPKPRHGASAVDPDPDIEIP